MSRFLFLDFALLCLNSARLFEELVEHHIIDSHISEELDLPLRMTNGQLGVYLGNILGDQAIIEILWLRALVRINVLFLKPVGDRFQLVDHLAGITHGVNSRHLQISTVPEVSFKSALMNSAWLITASA